MNKYALRSITITKQEIFSNKLDETKEILTSQKCLNANIGFKLNKHWKHS